MNFLLLTEANMQQSTQSASKPRKILFEWILLSILGALMFVGKLILSPLANIEPVTLLIMVITTCFGWKALYSVYIYVSLEILFYGIGIWNVMYLYVWAVLVLIVMLTRRFADPLINAIIAAFFGLFFGILCSPPYFVTLGVAGAVGWIINGIPYDIIHAVSNFLFVFLAFSPLLKVLKKALKKA